MSGDLVFQRMTHERTPPGLAGQVLAASRIFFPDFFTTVRSWEALGDYGDRVEHLFLLDGDLLAAHLALVWSRAQWNDESARVLGVAAVFSLPGYRGRGLSRRLFDCVAEELDQGAADFGLLFCLPALTRFYGALDWPAFPGRCSYGARAAPQVLDRTAVRARWRRGRGGCRPPRGAAVYVGAAIW
ncbi:MAG: hypothetical protein Kilf2KO_00310 [Rhodospirillales bacterium]